MKLAYEPDEAAKRVAEAALNMRLDPESIRAAIEVYRKIGATIREVSRGRDLITVLIAHRLSTVLHADRIYVLERGKVAEAGRHAELVEAKGLYYAMWRQQIGEGVHITRPRAKAGATA